MTIPPNSSGSAEAENPPQAPLRAKSLPLVGLRVDPPELVPARMVNEVLYCERLMYLEWVQGEFVDNFFTVDGRAAHRRADQPGGALPPVPTAPSTPDGEDPEPDPQPPPEEAAPYKARSVWLSSEKLGLTAKIDVVDGTADGVVVPIEYKRGKPPDVPEGAYLPERAQLCAQVLLLREHGYHCEEAQFYFAGAKRRVSITIDEQLIEQTLQAIARARQLAGAGELPPPLADSPKCNGCSLAGICLPDEVGWLRDGPEKASDEDRALRRLVPANEDQVPLYVQSPGSKVGLSGEVLVVTDREGKKTEARLPNTSQVALLGNVQISSQALRRLFERGIPVTFFSTGGYLCGRASGFESKNIELKIAQFRTADDPARCLEFARGFVVSKIKNCRTMLRRNHEMPDETVLSELDQLARKAGDAAGLESLLGLEGTAARSYFGQFTGMLKGAARNSVFDMNGRNRRPPKDPINALLSFAYSLLTKDLAAALVTVGLEPLLGFYHQPRFGRPALALDLMEEFRPIIADSVVIGALNNGVITSRDFRSGPAGCAMDPAGRRRLILAHERRLDQLVIHPLFGYRISYRRVLEVQARLMGRTLLGEIPVYPAFRTR